MLRRRHEMLNQSKKSIKLVHVAVYALEEYCDSDILPPASRFSYAASKFHCGRQPSAVYVYVDGHYKGYLQPEVFRRYIKMSFHVDGHGVLTVKGVEAKLSDYFRFWRRHLRRDYIGRPEEVIIIKQPLTPPPVSTALD